MYCGVVTRDRRHPSVARLFRPVVGSFVAHGAAAEERDPFMDGSQKRRSIADYHPPWASS